MFAIIAQHWDMHTSAYKHPMGFLKTTWVLFTSNYPCLFRFLLGYYGNDTERRLCEICPEGYYCPEGTGMGDSNPCQPGFFCPNGSAAMQPCQPGTYNKYEKSISEDACLPCGPNQYQDQAGLWTCKSCGSSSYSDPGAETCTCLGAYRAFQPSGSACVCYSGYYFFNEADFSESDADGSQDCQPIVLPPCDAPNARTVLGDCVGVDTYDCSGACFGSSGALDPDAGR